MLHKNKRLLQMNVQRFAKKVLHAPKGKYSAAMKKKAVFAANAAKWNH